jgi:hypothetical protein
MRQGIASLVVGIACGLVATPAGAAATYDVKVQSELNGLDIKVETVENPSLLVVRLTNATTQKVKCRLRFDAQPQPLMRKTVYVEAGKTEETPFTATTRWFDVDLSVTCEPDAK